MSMGRSLNGFKNYRYLLVSEYNNLFINSSTCSVRQYTTSHQPTDQGKTTPEESSRAPERASHFKRSSILHPLSEQAKLIVYDKPYSLPHPIWSQEEVDSVEITHVSPGGFVDKAAYYSVQLLRKGFDLFSGYSWGKVRGTLDEKKWLKRIIFLETVAGVPGMVAAMNRHLRSLRTMDRDHGWIHTLLEEAENERMHLLTALVLKKPGLLFRLSVLGTQGVFVTAFWIMYTISPRYCHRFVGYLEEEAVITYTHCLECIDNGDLKVWVNMAAPEIAKTYWKLKDDALMRDVILAIRADEAHHRLVNHTLSSMKQDKQNPFGPGQ